MTTYATGASGAPSANLGNPSVIDLVLGGTYVNTATGEIWHRVSTSGSISAAQFKLMCSTVNTNGDCNLQDATEVNFTPGVGFPGTINTVDEALNYLIGLDVCGGVGSIEIEYSTTIVVAASNSTARAREFADYTCTGTNDHLTIQSAIDEITDSGFKRIILMEGDYYLAGTITMTSNIVIEGQGESQTILHTDDIGTIEVFNLTNINNITFKNFKVIGDNVFINYIFSCTNTNNIIFENLNIENHYAYAAMDFYIGFNNIIVRNCKFIENRWGYYAIKLYAENTVHNYSIYIINNIFENTTKNSGDAISIDVNWNDDNTIETFDNKRIRQIVIVNNSYRGYSTGSYSGRGQLCYIAFSDNIIIANNSIEWAGYAIAFDQCSTISVTGNVITNCEVGIYASGDSWEIETGGGQYYWQITGNTIRDAYQGIAIVGNYSENEDTSTTLTRRTTTDSRSYGIVSGNSIHSDSNAAITCQVAANFTIIGNFLSCLPTYGIEVIDCWEFNIIGNNLFKCGSGIAINSSFDILFDSNIINENNYVGINLGGVKDIIVSNNYFVENNLLDDTDYQLRDHIYIDSYWDTDYTNNRITIKDNTFRKGYFTNVARYCVNVDDTLATEILIHGNDFRNGAATGTINIASGADVTHYNNWTDNGLSRSLYTGKSNAITISSDTITVLDNTSLIKLIPQTGSTDDLTTINDGFDGQIIYLQINNSSYTITLKNSTGNLDLNGGDISLATTNKLQPLLYSGLLNKWVKAN